MKQTINLSPIAFSKKGIESLLRQFKIYGYYEILEKHDEIFVGQLSKSLINHYLQKAIQDDNGTVYFERKSQTFVIEAVFEIKVNVKAYYVRFVFEDFIYKVMEP